MQWQVAAPITGLLVFWAHFGNKLTPTGILAAIATAAVAAYHPWNLSFTLLCVFFLIGNIVTKIKHGYKQTLTLTANGSGGEGPRTHTQVFANSLVATALTWMHTQQLKNREVVLLSPEASDVTGSLCYSWKGDILPIGIIACYAVAAADTFSSELGILARSQPRLITNPGRKVPRGTNGGVTIEGLVAGLVGSTIIAFTAVNLLPFCDENYKGALGGGPTFTPTYRTYLTIAISLWGVVGSIFDSWLGAMFQRTVRDARTGKIVEGAGGSRAMTTADEESRIKREAKAEAFQKRVAARSTGLKIDDPTPEEIAKIESDALEKATKGVKGDPSRVTENGIDFLDNNDVNFAMTFFMGMTAMALACKAYGVTFDSISKV